MKANNSHGVPQLPQLQSISTTRCGAVAPTRCTGFAEARPASTPKGIARSAAAGRPAHRSRRAKASLPGGCTRRRRTGAADRPRCSASSGARRGARLPVCAGMRIRAACWSIIAHAQRRKSCLKGVACSTCLPPPGGWLSLSPGPTGRQDQPAAAWSPALAVARVGEIRWRGESIRRARGLPRRPALPRPRRRVNDLLSRWRPAFRLRRRRRRAVMRGGLRARPCQRIGTRRPARPAGRRAVARPAPPRRPGAAVPVERAPLWVLDDLHRARRARSPISPPRSRSTATRAAW